MRNARFVIKFSRLLKSQKLDSSIEEGQIKIKEDRESNLIIVTLKGIMKQILLVSLLL